MAIPFNYASEYKRKLRTPDEAARVVKSGDWIDISMGGAFPSLMDKAIARRKDELRGVKIRGYLIFEPIERVECDPTREHFIYNSCTCPARAQALRPRLVQLQPDGLPHWAPTMSTS